VPIDLDHDHRPIGQLAFGEIADDGRLNCVAVLDDDAITLIEQPVYFSTECLMLGADVRERSYVAREAQLLSLALTCAPATVGAREVSWLRGDFRDSTTRRTWPIGWRSDAPLVARALDHQGSSLRTRSAARLVDRRADAGSDYPWGELSAHAWRARGDCGHRRPEGGPRYGPPGRILSVR
jgi:hypothetical protein